MSGIFSKPKTTSYEPAPEPSAAVEEATFKPGGEDSENDVKKRKMGKKRLQIPTATTTTATTGSGVGGI